jgi:hypothetical protein
MRGVAFHIYSRIGLEYKYITYNTSQPIHIYVYISNIKSAFLNGDLAEVFVTQALGFVVKGAKHKVLCLRKALYGLRQVPQAWNSKLNATMAQLGFARCATEHALYTRRRGKEELVIEVYVDDLIVTSMRDERTLKRSRQRWRRDFRCPT